MLLGIGPLNSLNEIDLFKNKTLKINELVRITYNIIK